MSTTAASTSVFPRSHVGFDSITSQIQRKLLKRGFQFNVICVGMCVTISSQVEDIYKWLTDNIRPNGSREVHTNQHHLRISPYRQQGTTHS